MKPIPAVALARALAVVSALLLAACATVPLEERMLVLQPDGGVAAYSLPCGDARKPANPAPRTEAGALDPRNLRIASWNIHKGEDAGWQADLARFAADYDVLLLQEAVLTPDMRDALERAGHTWQMAGAFAFDGEERGVLVAARVSPTDGCTLRAFEPLFPLPKSAIVARFRLAGRDATVAIANLHGINFTLGIDEFRAQLDAVAAELARNDGPIVFAGDFNTWSPERNGALGEVAARLGLVPVEIVPDGRRRAFGHPLDHLFVRGFDVIRAEAPEVKTSDHNPILVILVAR